MQEMGCKHGGTSARADAELAVGLRRIPQMEETGGAGQNRTADKGFAGFSLSYSVSFGMSLSMPFRGRSGLVHAPHLAPPTYFDIEV